jgi:hypothetical protein
MNTCGIFICVWFALVFIIQWTTVSFSGFGFVGEV